MEDEEQEGEDDRRCESSRSAPVSTLESRLVWRWKGKGTCHNATAWEV